MQKLLVMHLYKFGIKVLKSFSFSLAAIARKLDKVVILTNHEKEILKRNIQFKDKHKNQRAFIIVNGPSLKDQNIDWLGEELTFVVSGFYRHDIIKKWQPKYYSIIDKNFFNGSEQSATFFKQLNEKIKDSTFFFPLYRGYKANEKYGLVPKDRVFYIATAGLPNDQLDMTKVIQSFYGVSAFALAQAIYMGCNPIYLLGFDHDYLANRGVDRHFYSGGTIPGIANNNKPLSELIPYDVEMKANFILWKNYRSLNRIAFKKGIKIYNATRGGYLDVFERCDYEKIQQPLHTSTKR